MARTPMAPAVAAAAFASAVVLAAEPAARAAPADVASYFFRVGSLLFGSGYVLLPVLHGDLVDRLGWLSDRELLDAIAAGQATPGPLFTTATFVGYLLGGPAMAAIATVAMFAPAFLFSALSSAVLDRLRRSPRVRTFLDGVNAAAVALIAVVVVMLGRTAFDSWSPIAIGVAAAIAIFAMRVSATRVLVVAAAIGLSRGLWTG
jgi:chromate transporter